MSCGDAASWQYTVLSKQNTSDRSQAFFTNAWTGKLAPMMLIPKRRRWLFVTAVVVAAAFGAFSGYLAGRSVIRQSVEDKMTRDTVRVKDRVASIISNAEVQLATLNAPSFPVCSESDIAWLRAKAYRAEGFRDAGRMRDGVFECSAAFPNELLPRTLFKPRISMVSGLNVYRDLAPYHIEGKLVYILQKNLSYVVLDPIVFEDVVGFTARSESSILDISTQRRVRPGGGPSMVPASVRDRDWQGRVGDSLYTTRCTADRSICSTVYSSYSAALVANRSILYESILIGGLCGVVFTLLYYIFRSHSHSMSQQLRRAIRRDKLFVVYQPIVELHSGRVVEAEALLRWTDEEGFAVAPDIFVRLAEERGFVHELTRLVVRKVLDEMGELLRSEPDFHIHVNVAAFDLADRGFLPMLKELLDKAGVSPPSIYIEVTESSTARKQIAIETIRQLRARGHQVEIDDFGTGYSSLVYLKELHVDTIKIDKAFTQAIGTEAVISSILPQIMAMAEALGLRVVAEGIETAEQAVFFATWSHQMRGQGWHFGRPIPVHEFNREHMPGSLRRTA